MCQFLLSNRSCLPFHHKVIRHDKKKKYEPQTEETKQASEADSSISELSDREFKVTMINMLRFLMEKVDNIQGQTSDVRT